MPTSETVRHIASPIVDGYTLCHVTHDGDGPARMVKSLERVNCPNCRVIVNLVRQNFDETYRNTPAECYCDEHQGTHIRCPQHGTAT